MFDIGEVSWLLHDEVVNLQRSIAMIDAALSDPTLSKDANLDLWNDIEDAILLCQATIESFNRHAQDYYAAVNVKDHHVQARTLHKQQNSYAAERAILRAEIRSHQSTMHITLQALKVYTSSIINVDDEKLSVELHELLTLITEVRDDTFGQDAGSQRIRRSHRRLQASAKAVALNASRVLSTKSVASFKGPILQTSSTSSAPGASLTAEKRRRVSSWVASSPERDPSVPPMPTHPLLPRPRRFPSSTTATDPRVMKSRNSYHSEDSDDDELEMEIAYSYLAKAQRSAGVRDYAKAEALFRKCLQKAVGLGKRWNGLPRGNISLEIAIACYEQDKLRDATELIDELLRQAAEDDESRKTMLTAAHLKALILLRQGSLSSALRQCKHNVNCRRRWTGKDAAYYDSIALMATIHGLQKDEIEAETYLKLLPPDFKSPKFKPPIAAVQPVSTVNTTHLESASTVWNGIVGELDRSLAEQDGCSLSLPAQEVTAGDDQIFKASSNVSSSSPSSVRTLSTISLPSGSSASRTSLESQSSRYQQMPLPLLPSRSDSKIIFRLQDPLPSQSDTRKAKAQCPKLSSVNVGSSQMPVRGCSAEPAHTEARPRPQPFRATSDASVGIWPTTKNTQAEPTQTLGTIDVVRRPELTPSAKLEAQRRLEANGLQLAKTRDWREQYLWAAYHGHHYVLQLLLNEWQYQKSSRLGLRSREVVHHKAVPLDAVDGQGRSALHLAVLNRQTKIVELLLDHGASYTNRMEAIMASGDVPSEAPSAGRTALECAIVQGHHAMVEIFLRKGCVDDSTDRNGLSLLHHAAISCEQATFSLLLSAALDPARRTPSGKTPLHLAAQKGRESIVELLLQHSVEIDPRDQQGDTPLSLAVSGGCLQCVKMLQAAGADMRTTNLTKANLLHIAAREGHDHLLSFLVFKGTDIEGCDALGQSPLHYAAAFDKPQALSILISLGANVSAVDEEGNTALHVSAEAGHAAIVEAMHAQGLSLSQPNRLGRTPLHLAAIGGHRGIVLNLITGCDNVRQLDKFGMTPAGYARAKGHKQVADLLELNSAVG